MDEATRAAYSALGRYRASRRKPRESTCPVCGKVRIVTGRGDYCSNACRMKAYRARKRAQQGQPDAPEGDNA